MGIRYGEGEDVRRWFGFGSQGRDKVDVSCKW